MKGLIKFAVFIIILHITTNTIGQEPVFELKNIDNEWLTYTDVKGEKLTLIDFWASWCQPCLRSLPELNALYHEYKSQGVNLVGISIDGPRNQAKLKPFITSMGIDYTILRDINSEFMAEMNISAVPTLLLFDSKGKLLFLHEGYRPGDDTIIRKNIEKNL